VGKQVGKRKGFTVTGVKLPVGVAGASAVLSSHVAQSTLPFTGIALGAYVAIGGGLVITGIAMRLLGRTAAPTTTNA
jgi:hypothetical protein